MCAIRYIDSGRGIPCQRAKWLPKYFHWNIEKDTASPMPSLPPENLFCCLIYKITDSSKTLSSGKIQMPLERSRIKHYQSFLPLFEWFFFFQFDPALFHKGFEVASWKWVDQIWWKPMGTGKNRRRKAPPTRRALVNCEVL